MTTDNPIRIIQLHCWHANQLIYQAEGTADDGRCVYVRYRRPYFSVGVGPTLAEACGADTFVCDDHPDRDPSSITRATLEAWTKSRFEWPDRIDGYHNEDGPLSI